MSNKGLYRRAMCTPNPIRTLYATQKSYSNLISRSVIGQVKYKGVGTKVPKAASTAHVSEVTRKQRRDRLQSSQPSE